MKKTLSLSLFLALLLAACNENKRSSAPAVITDTNKAVAATPKADTTVAVVDNLGDFSDLVPLEIKDSASKNVYQKFGSEFSGNCYDCDLASLNFTKKALNFINVCDRNDIQQITDFSYSGSANVFKITANKRVFIFTKIDAAPVYQLQITGEKFSLKHKRIAKYFTQKQKLKKFKVHDCGDFQG